MNGFEKCTLYLTIYKKVKGFTVDDYYTKADFLYCEPITFFVPYYHESTRYLQTEILPDILLDFELELSEVYYEIN